MSTNPFVPPKPEQPPPLVDVGDALFGGEVSVTGPEAPGVVPVTDDLGPGWDETEIEATDALCVMSLHGGAGATTVTDLLGPDVAINVGHAWPVAAGWTRPRPVLDVLAVCRNNRKGIAAGTEFARQWAAGNLRSSNLLGVIIVDDAPRLLSAQGVSTKAIARMTSHGWHLPWHEPWRIEAVDRDALPRAIASVRRSIMKTQSKARKKRNRS